MLLRELRDALEFSDFIIEEIPTNVNLLPSKRFRLANDCIRDSLEVYFNGLRETHIVFHSDSEFSFLIDIINTDDIVVDYIKK